MKLFYKQQLMILFSFFVMLGVSNSFVQAETDQTSCPAVLLKAVLDQDYNIARLLLDQYGADPNASLEDCNNLDGIPGNFEETSLIDIALSKATYHREILNIRREDPHDTASTRDYNKSVRMYRLLVDYGATPHSLAVGPIVCEMLYGRHCHLL